jgi:hypothetical protein
MMMMIQMMRGIPRRGREEETIKIITKSSSFRRRLA